MTVVPRVYKFVPGAGALSGAKVVDGVWRVLDSSNPHHWTISAYTAGSTITIASASGQTVRITAQAENCTVYYSPDGNPANESTGSRMGGGNATYDFVSTFSPSSDEAFVVELEDAITVTTMRLSGASTLPDSLAMSFHAGRIYSAHNRNDTTLEHGVLAGICGVYNGSTWMWLNTNTTTNGTTQSLVWTGGATWMTVCTPLDINRHLRQASQVPMLANVGDAIATERLVPVPVCGPVSGTTGGHFGYTRYYRARATGYGGAVTNTTVIPSATDANIAWRHSYYYDLGTSTNNNMVHIWQQGTVVNVDAP